MSTTTTRPTPTLPRRGGPPFVTDGGLETDLIFHHGVDLPDFAAYPLLDAPGGRALLAGYYDAYAEIAERAGAGLVLETPTWRANPDWGARRGDDDAALARVDREAVTCLRELATGYAERVDRVIVCGMVGPRGDGYRPGVPVVPAEARDYHAPQVAALADAGADVVAAYTLTDPGEAIGVVAAAREHAVPVAVSFTVETDGRLPGGTTLTEAVERVDATTDGGPDYYLVNCAHPRHVLAGLPDRDLDARERAAWDRVVGLRPNASTQSHAELDEAQTLDEGDVADLVARTGELAERVGPFAVLGGCCGTDARHVAALWGVA